MPYNVKIELESLLKEINQVVRASSIYLFGSYAYGEPTEDSDLDICYHQLLYIYQDHYLQ